MIIFFLCWKHLNNFFKKSLNTANISKVWVKKILTHEKKLATKMESTLFVPVNLSFSENLRCLKMPLLVGAISQKRWPSETCFVFAGQNVNSGKFKHLKYSENVKFTGTNYIDSILTFSEDLKNEKNIAKIACTLVLKIFFKTERNKYTQNDSFWKLSIQNKSK